MTEIRFYHLQRAQLEDVLPVMLDRAFRRGDRSVVRTGSAERAEALAAHLWVWQADSFLPHGTARDGTPERQPVYLTAGPELPNDPVNLFLCDGAAPADAATLDRVQLLCEIFDGNDPDRVTDARNRWRDYRTAGHTLIYYQQDDRGRWEEKARA